MAQVTDPVCGMSVESETAAAQSQYQGRTFYFCSAQCKKQFDADPGRYTSTSGSARPESEARPG